MAAKILHLRTKSPNFDTTTPDFDTTTPDLGEHRFENMDTCERILPNSDEYFTTVEKLGDEIEYFSRILSPEEARRFVILISLFEDVNLMEKREVYAHGLKTAMRID